MRLIALILAGLLTAAWNPAGAAPLTGSCNLAAGKYIASATQKQATSTAFVNIPEASIAFKQGGKSPGCVLVTFVVEVSSNTQNPIPVVRAILDTAVALPKEVPLYRYEAGLTGDTRSLTFLFHNVKPGQHTLRMQFKNPGNPVFPALLGPHYTVVHYTP
jgi:hypothetical protein